MCGAKAKRQCGSEHIPIGHIRGRRPLDELHLQLLDADSEEVQIRLESEFQLVPADAKMLANDVPQPERWSANKQPAADGVADLWYAGVQEAFLWVLS